MKITIFQDLYNSDNAWNIAFLRYFNPVGAYPSGEMVKGFEKASGKKISYKIEAHRPGDIAACYADASKAKKELN